MIFVHYIAKYKESARLKDLKKKEKKIK